MPFSYDDKSPRLPRKQSTGYDLQDDTDSFFKERICPTLPQDAGLRDGRFAVLITVFIANDGLGRADLDNYAKTILDAITNSACLWKNDSQVDFLNVNREVSSLTVSYMELEVLQYSQGGPALT